LGGVGDLEGGAHGDDVGAEGELVGDVGVGRADADLGGEALQVGADQVDDRDRGVEGAGHVGDDGVEIFIAGVTVEAVAVDGGESGGVGDGGARALHPRHRSCRESRWIYAATPRLR